MKRTAWIAAAVILVGAFVLARASDLRTPPPGEGPEAVAVRTVAPKLVR